MKRKVITMGILHSNKFEYFKYPPQKYSGNIIDDINKAKIYEEALDESIDLTLNYFNEIKNYLKETQSNLYNINYDLTKKYYNDFKVWESFNNYIEAVDNGINNKLEELNDKYNNIIQSVDNDINDKLENMYKELNDKHNNIVSVFNEVIDKIAWWIPFKKFRNKFREKFRIVM